MSLCLNSLAREKKGQAMLEYVLVLALITLLLIGGLQTIGQKAKVAVDKVAAAFPAV